MHQYLKNVFCKSAEICLVARTGADSTYGTDSSLGTNSSYGIGFSVELIPCDSNSISVVYGSNSGSGSRKNGILTSLAKDAYEMVQWDCKLQLVINSM